MSRMRQTAPDNRDRVQGIALYKGGDSAQDSHHGTLKFRQPATVSANVTQ